MVGTVRSAGPTPLIQLEDREAKAKELTLGLPVQDEVKTRTEVLEPRSDALITLSPGQLSSSLLTVFMSCALVERRDLLGPCFPQK